MSLSPVPAGPGRFGDGRDWFFKARFGLFIHWGVYAVNGWHEQEMFRRGLDRAAYAAICRRFNPTRFRPDDWLDVAAEAGMRYLTFTTKHVDGVCMWDSRHTACNVVRQTPYARDPLALLAAACHRRRFPLCLYYSCADMHQPSYPNAGRSYELPAPASGDTPNLARYIDFVKAQVTELCTRYGKIHGFWWDANVVGHRDPSVNALIRRLQPAAIINNRGYDDGDFGTPEREYDNSVDQAPWFERPVEACQSVGRESWGWRRDEDYFSDDYLIGSIQKVLAKGGNYLLNVGPRPDGTLPPEAVAMLRRIGRWFHAVKESLLDAAPAGALSDNREVLLTRRGKTLYVHLHRPPVGAAVYLPPLTLLPRRATLLNSGAAVDCDIADLPSLHARTPNRCLRLRGLPVNRRAMAGTVIKLEFGRRLN